MRRLLNLGSINVWIKSHYLQLAIFNMIIGFMILLRTAGYFHPFFVLSINFIFLASFILAIVLLGARSRAMFLTAICFWFLAGFFKAVKIEVWADRTAIYVFQALILGASLLIFEFVDNNFWVSLGGRKRFF